MHENGEASENGKIENNEKQENRLEKLFPVEFFQQFAPILEYFELICSIGGIAEFMGDARLLNFWPVIRLNFSKMKYMINRRASKRLFGGERNVYWDFRFGDARILFSSVSRSSSQNKLNAEGVLQFVCYPVTRKIVELLSGKKCERWEMWTETRAVVESVGELRSKFLLKEIN